MDRKTNNHFSKTTVFSTFALGIIFLFGLISAAYSLNENAESGSTDVYLPVISTTREFEANLVTNQFDNISHITHAGDDRLFIVERDGRILIWHPNETIKRVVCPRFSS